METHAFGFRLRANAPEAKSDFLSVEAINPMPPAARITDPVMHPLPPLFATGAGQSKCSHRLPARLARRSGRGCHGSSSCQTDL